MEFPSIVNIVMETGVDKEYTAPATCHAVLFQAVGGNIAMKNSASGPEWTLIDGMASVPINTASIANKTLLFNGATGVTLQVIELNDVL